MTYSLTAPGAGLAAPRPTRPIPVPDIPVQPVLSLRSLGFDTSPRPASVLDAGETVFTPSGEAALALAAQLMEILPGQEILLPAYHCAAMVQPFSALGAVPRFYRLRQDLSADLGHLERQIGPRTRAIVAVHYFGFPQNLGDLRRLCDAKSLALLEDCAHSLFGQAGERPLGCQGDYAIASLWKFFPVSNGGCLVSARHRLSGGHLQSQGLSADLRAAIRLVEEANYYGRLPALKPILSLLFALIRRAKGSPETAGEQTPALEAPKVTDASATPHAQDGQRMTIAERLLCRHVSWGRITRQRRRRYRQLLSALGGLPGVRPLFPELPETVVPYLFPLRVEALAEIFPKLEDAALPLQRFGQFLWPGVDASVCAVSADYAQHVVQLPCHQELRDDEFAWMIQETKRGISA